MTVTAEAVASSPSRVSSDGVGRSRSAATITPVAWIPESEMDLAEWSTVGRRLGSISRCSAWWIGDWIRYGNAKFGEKYSRAAKITAYDSQTLMNMVYVASRFDASRRREALSWSHHETVASLDLEGQDRWLETALDARMSVADLRLALRSRRGDLEGAEGLAAAEQGGEHEEPTVSCPNCGHSISHSLFDTR